jgi:formylglycine-generating enzyme required for sulfatase activity
MAQTPITQAQWRVVAGWEAKAGEVWGRELLPNPSRFQIEGEASTDQRPVEQVTWLDAMEFLDSVASSATPLADYAGTHVPRSMPCP